MKTTIKVENDVNITTLEVNANVRYWEDGTINGVEDESGNITPCKNGETWSPIIDVETGIITNWEKGKTAKIHYKVCDDGNYILKDDKGAEAFNLDGYVPSCLAPKENGYGDYIILDIDAEGKIDGWKFTEGHLEDFKLED